MLPNVIYSSLLDVLGRDEQSRVEVMRRRWEAYYGKLPPVLKVRPGQMDDNVRINYARMIVDKGVSFLFGQDVGFEIDEVEETDAEQWLSAVWQANRKMSLLQTAALVGGVTGHVFVKIVPADPYPRLIVIDPETVTMSLAPDDAQQILSYQISYTEQDPKTKKPVGIRQVIERDGLHWRIVDQVGDLERLTWSTVNEAVWPYEFSPIVDCQNLPAPGEFWGQSDLEDDVIEIIRAINFIASNTARIIRFHAHPKTWGRGFTAKDLRIGVDETIILPGENGELRNLEMQSDLASSLRYLDMLRQALHEISRVPEVATGNLDQAGSLSGVALQILYQPLLEKTNTKRLLYGDMLIELNRRLLAIGGFGDELHTALHWQEVLPQDPMQERQAALIDIQLGVSQDTLLQRLGYDPDLERQKREAASADLGEQLLMAFDKGQ
ncbi:MAG: phage portal protein [Anaerolineales bacterium]